MKVGVKFCGGCNPRYDRRKVLEAYQHTHPEDVYSYAKEGETYDLLLVLYGCKSHCANCSSYTAKDVIFFDKEI